MTRSPLSLSFTPQAVLFDLDGVITDSMPLHLEAWQRVFEREGIRLDRLDVYRREGEKGETSARDFLLQHGRSADPSSVRRILQAKEALFKQGRKVQLFAGAAALIHELQTRRVPLALVTGTSRGEVERVLPDGLLECFASVVTGDRVAQGKPDPEPYRLALRELAAAPSRAVVLENAPFGIASAKRAGAFVVALTTSLPAAHLAEADLVLESLAEVRGLLLGPAGAPG